MRRAANPWDRFYREHTAPWRGERAVEPLRPYLGDGPVLELGVGNGKMLRPLQGAGVDVVGLDVSWNALHRLGEGVLADASALPFRDGAFSSVLDIHCTGHLPATGRAAAAHEAVRVLRPRGHLVVERLMADDLRASQGSEVPGEAGMRVLQDGRATHFTTEADLRADMEAAGLMIVDSLVERRTPRLGRERVVRSSVRVVARRT